MADYRHRITGWSLCTTGPEAWQQVDMEGRHDWQDASGSSGSGWYTVTCHNTDGGTEQVAIRLAATILWNVSFDKNNRMIVDIDNHIERVWQYREVAGTHWEPAYRRCYIIRTAANGQEVARAENFTMNDLRDLIGSCDARTHQVIDPGMDGSEASLYAANFTMDFSNEASCDKFIDKFTVGVQFHNNREWNWDSPTINSVDCKPVGGGASFDFNVSWGDVLPSSGSNTVKVEVSDRADFSRIVWSRETSSSPVTVPDNALASNTKYYVRYTATNKGGKTATKTCEFTTLCRSNIRQPLAQSGDCHTLSIPYVVQYGGRAYQPSTEVYYKTCDGDNWQKATSGTQSTTTTGTAVVTDLEGDTCYEFQTRTTTTAGTYTSPTVQYTTIECDATTGVVDSVDPYIAENGFECDAKYCVTITSNCVPVEWYIEYRIKGGSSQTWMRGDTQTLEEIPDGHIQVCLDDLKELLPNQVQYEIRVHTSCGESEGSGPVSEFTTPILPHPENYTCENFQYLTDMICQSLYGIQDGMKDLYANDDVKELCDPYSNTPTLASMWSRVVRFFHAAACIMCDMFGTELKAGSPGQIYMGEVGWTDLDDKPTEGSEQIVKSDGIYDMIQESIHEVWHSHGTVTYLVGLEADLKALSDAEEGDKALVAENDTFYTYTDGAWVKGEAAGTDDFTVYFVLKASNTELGDVKAHSSWYYFGGGYQQLDARIDTLEPKIEELEEKAGDLVQSVAKDINQGCFAAQVPWSVVSSTQIKTLSVNIYNNYNPVQNGNTDCGIYILFVTEPKDYKYPDVYTVTYDTDGGYPEDMNDEHVCSGTVAHIPYYIPRKDCYEFVQWEDTEVPGEAFDFSLPIVKNYNLKAVYRKVKYTIEYDLEGGTGEAPAAVEVECGSPFPLPEGDGLTKDCCDFSGWLRNGVPLTAEDTVYPDTKTVDGKITLKAYWKFRTYSVTFDPGNGEAETIYPSVQCGTTPPPAPDDPTWEEHVFLGWVYEDGTPYDPDRPITESTKVVGSWRDSVLTITFKPGGGNEDFTQDVDYGEQLQKPTDPEWKDTA